MPPKPWEKKGVLPAQNISQIIQSNPTVKEEVPKVSTDPALNDPKSINSLTGTANSLGGASPYSSYGGMGSYGGLGGSMLGGGYGMGGMYGGMGGMGGMGMYGMGMGMGMGMDQNSTLFNSMMAMQSFGFLINSLCEIARSLDQNYEGLQLFKTSFKNLSSKVQNGVKESVVGAGERTRSAAFSIMDFIKKYILCMGCKDDRSKEKSVRIIMALAAFLLIISFYPLIRRYLCRKV